VPLFEDSDTLLSWGRGALIDAEGRRTRVMTTMKRVRKPITHVETAAAFHRLTRENFLTPSVTVMVRRSAIDAVGGFRQTGSRLFVDLPTWLWLTAVNGGHVTYLDRELGIYRHHVAGTSTDKAAQMKLEHLRVVLAVESEVGGGALTRAGWDARSRRRALARGSIVRGKLELKDQRWTEAYATFRGALGSGDARMRLRALRGMLSARVRALLARGRAVPPEKRPSATE